MFGGMGVMSVLVLLSMTMAMAITRKRERGERERERQRGIYRKWYNNNGRNCVLVAIHKMTEPI